MSPDTDPHRAGGQGLVFACVAPHGGLVIREACAPHEADLARATRRGMLELGRRCEAAAPEVLVVLTPHGVHLTGHFGVVVAGRMAGSLDEAASVALDVPVAQELALAILEDLEAAGLPAAGVSYGANSPSEAVMPLDWGTLIPLWFLGGRNDPPRAVVVLAPARDRPITEHLEAGRVIADAARRCGLRVGLVASADQSHTHGADGPYGFSATAAELDRQIVATLRERRLKSLLDLDPALVAEALPDSWWQMVMLAGAIGDDWEPVVLSYEAPTYYGMLCAAFEPPAGS